MGESIFYCANCTTSKLCHTERKCMRQSHGSLAPTCSGKDHLESALERIGWMLVTQAPEGIEGTITIYESDLKALEEELQELRDQNQKASD